ncbi:MAG: RIP metalloprotease [Candidatus Baltobacteraceae bacterium]
MFILALVSVAAILKVVLFVAVLSVLIVLHEYGHFIVARWNGVRVLEFSVGMGPLLASLKSKRSGTQYSLRAFPIGGYCAMHGEDNKTSEAGQQREFRQTVTVNEREYDEDNFQAKSGWRRFGIVLAGPVANFILAFAILLIAAIAFGVPSKSAYPGVGPLVAGMPAERAGIRSGDLIVAVNGKPYTDALKLVDFIHKSRGKKLAVTYARAGLQKTVTVTPASCPPPQNGQGCIGFKEFSPYVHVGFVEAVKESGADFAMIAQQTFGSLAMLVSHPVKYGGQVSGVVGMGQAAVAIQDFGWGPYFFFAALISFALGVFNLLPLPALDGGRAAFIVGELVRGKPVDPEKEAWVHITGFAVLIALMLVINFYNVVQIVQGKGPF